MWEDAHICRVPDFVICAIDRRRAMDKTSVVFRCDTFALRPDGGGRERGKDPLSRRCGSMRVGARRRARLYREAEEEEEEDESAIPFINRYMEMGRGKIMG